jgi:hypothetical protein
MTCVALKNQSVRAHAPCCCCVHAKQSSDLSERAGQSQGKDFFTKNLACWQSGRGCIHSYFWTYLVIYLTKSDYHRLIQS